MQNLINSNIQMTSLEVAELVNKRHDNVKRTIETLISRGVITSPQIEDGIKSANGVTPKLYIFKGEQEKRDSIIVVAQLSPEFTARLVDRWKELEEAKPNLPHLSKMEMIAAIATNAVLNEKRLMAVEQKIEQMEQGSIPSGYQGYSYLKSTYDLSDGKCRQLVIGWEVENKKVPHVIPNGQVSQMSIVHEESFKHAIDDMMDEAEQRGSQWYHPKMGRFSITGWKDK
ncbi:MAG: Rha family transcriptional regulator [Candidatus Arsenophonus phytopathogenicus]